MAIPRNKQHALLNMRSLLSVDVGDNQIADLGVLQFHPTIVNLNIENNALAEIPPELSLLKQLQVRSAVCVGTMKTRHSSSSFILDTRS